MAAYFDVQEWNEPWGSGVWASILNLDEQDALELQPSNEDFERNPSDQQAQTCLRVCQSLSNLYQEIHLFRFDKQKGEVYILAGEDIEITIDNHGVWNFVTEA